jgi:hypothetical protein
VARLVAVGGRQHRGAQVRVAVDERAVHAGAAGDRGDGDLLGLGAHLGQGLADMLAPAGDVLAAGLHERVRRGAVCSGGGHRSGLLDGAGVDTSTLDPIAAGLSAEGKTPVLPPSTAGLLACWRSPTPSRTTPPRQLPPWTALAWTW